MMKILSRLQTLKGDILFSNTKEMRTDMKRKEKRCQRIKQRTEEAIEAYRSAGFNTDPNTIPYEDQAKYVQTIMDVLGEHDVPWSWWAYCNGEFAIYKKTSMFGKYQWNDTLIDVMMK